MELFRSDRHFIFVKDNLSLWWNKQTGKFSAKSDWEWANASNLECVGLFYGIIGKINQVNILDTRLMLIKEIIAVGELQGGHIVYKIKSIAFLHLGSENFDIGLFPCAKHQNGFKKKPISNHLFDTHKSSFAKTWGTIKNATNSIKHTTQQAAALATSQVKSTVTKKMGIKDKEKFERRILEELNKIFTETDSFFFCQTRDITNSLQRLYKNEIMKENQNLPMWQTVDDRFFWNKFMLQDIINLNTRKADYWILPIIQGYVQIEKCEVEVGYDGQPLYEIFNVGIISRRSRYRAGTRYKRRGVDENGKCANYVETEQLVWYHDHQVSFVQVRGSVPVYWSQPGYKYKPPPRIDKDETETQIAFEKHFNEELNYYGPVCIVNLVEQTGKESIIWEAYSNHVLKYNNIEITYVTFDFHEYCRGMHFENVSILVSSLTMVLSEMGFCWYDKQGAICIQKGVFRVNCIDCLDRTNVVQTALGKAVMEIQFSKLGLIPPDGSLPTNIRQTFQLLWANNGDIISKQYAGTNALKGDYTRTGERKFTGLMKDGMNSANRYYLNRFKDVYRQAIIDMMLGNLVSDEIFHDKNEEEDNTATVVHVKLLIEDCKKLLIPNPELILNSWGLIDADIITGEPTETEMDSILILTRDSYYIADYDEQIDKVTNYQRVLLKDISLIECGHFENTISLFKNVSHYCIRINYKVNDKCGYFHIFRSTNLRFFNNMAVVIKTEEEIIESLKAIAEAISVAIEIANLPKVQIMTNVILDKQKSNIVNGKAHTGLLDISSFSAVTKNTSDTQLNVLQVAEMIRVQTENQISIHCDTKLMETYSTSVDTVIDFQNKDVDKTSIEAIIRDQSGNRFNTDLKIQKSNYKESSTKFSDSNSYSKKNRSSPEIMMHTAVEDSDSIPNSKYIQLPLLILSKNISHSMGEVDNSYISIDDNILKNNTLQITSIDMLRKRSTSEQDLTLSISSSQSESALKPIKANINNTFLHVTANTRDILSPFTKFAKGVQTLSANLDPRKFKSTGQAGIGGISRNLLDHQFERDKIHKKWIKCKSRLIAL